MGPGDPLPAGYGWVDAGGGDWRVIRVCSEGDGRKVKAHGWCSVCYDRWLRHGRPEDGPPPPTGRTSPRLGRIEDYAELKSWGVDRSQAAERLGLSLRTIERYEQELAA